MAKERTTNGVGIDHGCDLEAFRPCFLFFLLLSGPLDFRELQEPLTSAFLGLFIAKQATWNEGSSPRRADNFILKQIARLGELVTSS